MTEFEQLYYLIGYYALVIILQLTILALVWARFSPKYNMDRMKRSNELLTMGRISDLGYARLLGENYDQMQEICIENLGEVQRLKVNRRMPKERREMIGISRRKWLDKRILLLEETLDDEDKATLENWRRS